MDVIVTDNDVIAIMKHPFLKTESDPVFTAWDKSTGISITESQISDFGTYLTDFSGLTAQDVAIPKLGTPTYLTQADYNNSFGGAGRKTGGVISDAGSSYVAVTAGTGFIKATDDDNAELLSFDFPAPSNIAIPASSTRYIGVEYNSGAPRVVARTSYNWNLDTEFPLGRVINEPINSIDTLHIINNPWWVTDGMTNIIERFQSLGRIRRDEEVGGLILSVTGTRNVSVTGGRLWSNLNEFPVAAIDTAVSDNVELYWYSSTGGWQQSDVTQYSVTQWNDPTQATLQTISNNKFCNIWVYAESDDQEISLLYPQNQYNTAAEAEAVKSPGTVPTHIANNGILIGRIIIKQGVDAPVSVQSTFTTPFSASVVTSHTNLINLDYASSGHTGFEPARGADDNYVTDAQLVIIGNTSGTNTGDNAVNSNYSSLVSNATHTGEVTGSTTLTLDKSVITGKTEVTVAASDYVLISDTSDSGNLKKVLASAFSGSTTIYPDEGIPLSTGSAWGTSITNNSANWNTAYGWGDHASAGYLTSSSTGVTGDWTINSDLGDVTSMLTFGRTTGGSATITWDGTNVINNKSTKILNGDLIIENSLGGQSRELIFSSTSGLRYIDQSLLTIRFLDSSGSYVRNSFDDSGNASFAGDITLNSDLGDVTSTLTFGRTTGGSGGLSYNGAFSFDKKVGIGTTSPNTNLYIQATADPIIAVGRGSIPGSNDKAIFVRYLTTTDVGEIGAYENGIGAKNLILQRLGGSVAIGASSFIATEKLRVNGDAYLDGDLTIVGGAINFPSTQEPSSGANTLDDYEEGTYSPTVTCVTEGSYNIDSSLDTAYYIKIGKKVHISGELAITSANDTPTGELRVSTPLASQNSSEYRGFGTARIINHGASNLPDTYALLYYNSSYFTIMFQNVIDGGTGYIHGEDIDTAFNIRFSIDYIAAN